MPFSTNDWKPKACVAWLVSALVLLQACEQTKVSAPAGPAQARQVVRAPITMEPAIPAPSRPYRGTVDISGGLIGDADQETGQIRVGLLLPLSGPEAALGHSLFNAAQMALFDIAKDGFVVLPQDTGGTPEGAEEAARTAIAQRASILLGPVFSASVAAVAPIARAAGINVIAFSNNRSVAREGTFLMGLLPRQQIRRVVRYARSQGILRFAALVPDSAFGRQVEQYFAQAVDEIGGVVAQIERAGELPDDAAVAVRRLANYDDRQAALLEQRAAIEAGGQVVTAKMIAELQSIDDLTDLGFDALLIAVSGTRLKAVAALLPFYDIDTTRIKVLGLSSWQTDGLGREPPLVGAWFAAPSATALGNFDARYRVTFGTAVDPLATLAYDATALAAVLARSEAGPDFSLAALTSASGFIGTTGIFRFRETGESERGLSVFEVGQDKSREISRAPETFEVVLN